jgi:hypothetical protein
MQKLQLQPRDSFTSLEGSNSFRPHFRLVLNALPAEPVANGGGNHGQRSETNLGYA